MTLCNIRALLGLLHPGEDGDVREEDLGQRHTCSEGGYLNNAQTGAENWSTVDCNTCTGTQSLVQITSITTLNETSTILIFLILTPALLKSFLDLESLKFIMRKTCENVY